MGNVSKCIEFWWQGLHLWYNDQDYIQAINAWEHAVGFFAWPDDETFKAMSLREAAVQEQKYLAARIDAKTISNITPLLLFLAGCYLDACEYQKARATLRHSLALVAFREEVLPGRNLEENELFNRIIRECTFCMEEDPACQKPWVEAREITQYALTVNEQFKVGRYGLDSEHFSMVWQNEWQRPGFLYPINNQKGVYDRLNHPSWCRVLEEKWGEIRNEFELLIQRPGRERNLCLSPRHWPAVGSGVHRGGAGAHDGSVVAPGGDWREVVLFGSGETPRLAPLTCQLLEKICPDAVSLARQGGGEIVFSVLAPGTHIRPHCGSTNLRLTAHLGLVIPKDDGSNKHCSIRVADQWLQWEEGKIIVFDDSFEHEVINEMSSLRGVLLIRFWHPNLPKEERGVALQKAFDAKVADELQRYIPPSPTSDLPMRLRAFERNRCASCSRHGYNSVRLDTQSLSYLCQCGQPIT